MVVDPQAWNPFVLFGELEAGGPAVEAAQQRQAEGHDAEKQEGAASPVAPAKVGPQRRQDASGGEGLRATADVVDDFAIGWMQGEQQRCCTGGNSWHPESQSQCEHAAGVDCMSQQIHQQMSPRCQAGNAIGEGVRQDDERAKHRPVGSCRERQRIAEKHRRVGDTAQVGILHDGVYVVVLKDVVQDAGVGEQQRPDSDEAGDSTPPGREERHATSEDRRSPQQPPAMAGTMETLSPSLRLVSLPSRKRISSSLT